MTSKTKRPDFASSTLTAIPGFQPDQLVDRLPCYVSIQDRDLQIVFANENFKKDFGDGVGKKCQLPGAKNF